jgi:hypothetical protein
MGVRAVGAVGDDAEQVAYRILAAVPPGPTTTTCLPVRITRNSPLSNSWSLPSALASL